MENIQKKTKLGILALCVALCFTGCADKGSLGEQTSQTDNSSYSETSGDIPTDYETENTAIERTSVSTVRDTFDEEIEALRAEKFDNISFENLKTYSFPDVSEITAYKVTRYEDGNDLSPEQFFENFITYYNYFGGGELSEAELAEEVTVVVKGEDEHCNYNQFQELNKDGELTIVHISLEVSDIYLAYFGRGPYWYIDDALTERHTSENGTAPRSPMKVSVDTPIVYYTEDMSCTDVYQLIDGEISIADAVEKVNAILAEIAEQCDDNMCERIVCAVKVLDMGDGYYGYEFTTTPVVDNIRYAYADTRSDAGGYYFYAEEGHLGNGAGSGDYATVLTSEKLHTLTNSGGWKEITPVDVYDSIVPLKTAAENAATLLSGEMNFKAKSVTLVYDLKGDSDDLVPCWRFVLENSLNREQYYHVYVNAITSEARVKAIQKVSSGYDYD